MRSNKALYPAAILNVVVFLGIFGVLVAGALSPARAATSQVRLWGGAIAETAAVYVTSKDDASLHLTLLTGNTETDYLLAQSNPVERLRLPEDVWLAGCASRVVVVADWGSTVASYTWYAPPGVSFPCGNNPPSPILTR